LFLMVANGLAMVRVPQGMHYSRCCHHGERGIRTSGDIFLLYNFHNSLINNLLVK